MKITISHDYLLQFGGAERVVATWAESLTGSPIYCLAYQPNLTYDVFTSREVHTQITSSFLSSRVEMLLPILPVIASQLRVEDADLALISTSGWAHGFSHASRTLTYVHSPARWLYAKEDYAKQLNSVKKLGLAASSPYLRLRDKRSMARMSQLVANGVVSQRRIQRAYNILAPIVHPPVIKIAGEANAPVSDVFERFSLVVSRNRGYKNTKLAVEASIRAGIACVVVGSGSETMSDSEHRVLGLGRVADSELKWLYMRAAVIVGSAHEDFGLTVLEANLEGTPAAVIPFGGYLETVDSGVNGIIASDDSVESLALAIRDSAFVGRSDTEEWAGRFSPANHMRQLMEIGSAI